jgi:hypothetical protein
LANSLTVDSSHGFFHTVSNANGCRRHNRWTSCVLERNEAESRLSNEQTSKNIQLQEVNNYKNKTNVNADKKIDNAIANLS